MLQLDAVRIQQALARIRTAKSNTFGAAFHRFSVNEPLAEAEVVAFERKHGVVLPSDYRQFITEVGNGGAGPFCGIFPLGMMDASVGGGAKDWAERDGVIGVVGEPFTLESEWNDIAAMPPDSLADSDEAEYELKMEEFEKQYWHTSLVNGAIPICHQGCALRVWLVMTGTQAGTLWEDRRSEYAGIRPVRLRDGTAATFGRWYEEWLDDCAHAPHLPDDARLRRE